MNISLLAIGTELLNGKVQELNTHSLSKQVTKFDFTLVSSLSVIDSKVSIHSAIDYLSTCSDVIIVSGGLGPTKDDITKEVLIEKLGDNFSEITNHNGVAKGLSFDQKVKVFATPGVPAEFEMMIKKEIIPSLNLKVKDNNQVIFKTYKMGEAKIFNELCPTLWSDLEKFGEVSSLPILSGVNIGVNLIDISKKEELINFVKSTKLNDLIWNIGAESLEEVIINKAKSKKLKIGFAESCTGGLVASKITDVSGSSSVLWGSIVSYSNDVKEKSLNVNEETIRDHGAVSIEVAKEMASGARRNLGVDIAVSTTGIAGPNGGSENKPVGTVCIGISTKNKTEAFRLEFKGNREILKERFAKAALYKLLENLNN